MRSIDTRFWSDIWVRKLNALDRYVFLYFLTNDHSSWCGVYELDIAMMAFETGIDENDLKRSILPRLRPKVLYIDGWVFIKNFEKYHNNRSEQTQKGIANAWKSVPDKIRLKIKEIIEKDISPTGGMVGVSSSAFTSASSSASSSAFTSALKNTSASADDSFTKFWSVYPRKELKKKTEEIWKRKKFGQHIEKIISFVEEAKKSDRWKKGFIKQPPAFLNGECWNDDLQSYRDITEQGEKLTISRYK